MSVNRFKPHVYLVPEDDANRQLANGFRNHIAVDDRATQVMPLADGWPNFAGILEEEYVPKLKDSKYTHVIVLADFDEQGERRYAQIIEKVPEEYRDRVFVIGAFDEPEAAKNDLRKKLEEIGDALAEDCDKNSQDVWGSSQFQHNERELERLREKVKPILFGS